jgi:hypothetical protein
MELAPIASIAALAGSRDQNELPLLQSTARYVLDNSVSRFAAELHGKKKEIQIIVDVLQNEQNRVKRLFIQDFPIGSLLFTAEMVALLVEGISHENCKLKHLTLPATVFDEKNIEAWKILFLSQCNRITRLFIHGLFDLSGNTPNYKVICPFFQQILSHPGNVFKQFGFTCVINEEISFMFQNVLSSRLNNLLEVNIVLAPSTDDNVVQRFADALTHPNCKIAKIQIEFNSKRELERIPAIHLRMLCTALKQSSIEKLCLANSLKLGDSQISIIKDLLSDEKNKIRRLKLSSNYTSILTSEYPKTTDLFLKMISEVLVNPHTRLQHMDLDGTPLSRRHLPDLINAIKRSPLRSWEGFDFQKKTGEFVPEITRMSKLLKDPTFQSFMIMIASKYSKRERHSLFRSFSTENFKPLARALFSCRPGL